jgi:hypothetical protein
MTANHGELAEALRSACDKSKIGDGGLVEDALRLVLAFMRIGDPAVRRAIIDIVERIPDRRSKDDI